MKSKNLLIILGFFILLVAFYWFQYRPTKIRADCAKIATENAQEKLKYEADKPGWQEVEEEAAARDMFRQPDYLVYLSRCLDEHGLK